MSLFFSQMQSAAGCFDQFCSVLCNTINIYEKLDDSKEIIRSFKSQKDRQLQWLMKKTQQKVKSLSTKHHTDMNYILNSNTSYSTIPQQQSAKDRMCHILMAVPDVGPVCCRCIGISYSGCVTTPAYSCILLCRILEGTYNRKPVLKCTTGLFEFVVPS